MSQMATTTGLSARVGQGEIAESGILFPPQVPGKDCGRNVRALASPERLTELWLTDALRLQHPHWPEVETFSCEPVTATDFDILVRLHLSYKNDTAEDKNLSHDEGRISAPVSILAKFSRPLPGPEWEEFVRQSLVREASAYQDLTNHYACRIPGLLFAVTGQLNFNLLLEDCGGECFTSDNSPDEHLPEHEAVLHELAQLHGCFVRTSPASAPRWQLRQRDHARFISHHYRRGVDALREVYAGWLAPEHFELVEAFTCDVADWHRYERHTLTLTHGDARFENVLFQRDGSNCRASLASWKLVGVRNPMFDVACLLSNDLSYVARNHSEATLLQRYCRVFEQSGTQYPLREASEDYRFHLFAPLIFNICAAGFLQETLVQNADLMKKTRRNCMAILDWDSMTLMAKRRNVIA